MSDRQDGHPNLNRGGTNPGGGRPRNVVRAKFLKGADHGAKDLVDATKWKRVFPIVNAKGEITGKRPPTPEEWKWAVETAAKYGLGTKDEIVVLGNEEVLEVFADVLSETIEDAGLVDRILAEVGARLNGEGQ